MTVSGDFMPSMDEDLSSPSYPTLFGIALSPAVLGVLIALLGVGIAAGCFFYLLQPTQTRNQELTTTFQARSDEATKLQGQVKNIAQAQAALATAKQRREDVLALFSNEQTLDTLLLDINRLVKARNLKLLRFTPALSTETNVITDGSLGTAVNGKLERRNITMEVEGTFEQTQSLLRGIERLQPLLLVRSFNSNLDRAEQRFLVDPRGRVVSQRNLRANLKTTFVLQALLPVEPPPAPAPGTPGAPPQK